MLAIAKVKIRNAFKFRDYNEKRVHPNRAPNGESFIETQPDCVPLETRSNSIESWFPKEQTLGKKEMKKFVGRWSQSDSWLNLQGKLDQKSLG